MSLVVVDTLAIADATATTTGAAFKITGERWATAFRYTKGNETNITTVWLEVSETSAFTNAYPVLQADAGVKTDYATAITRTSSLNWCLVGDPSDPTVASGRVVMPVGSWARFVLTNAGDASLSGGGSVVCLVHQAPHETPMRNR